MLTDKHLVTVKPHPLGGVQRLYRFNNNMGLSIVNSPMLHSYPFAWEAAVLNGMQADGSFQGLDYSTELTSDVVVFQSDLEANSFIHKAAILFNGERDATHP